MIRREDHGHTGRHFFHSDHFDATKEQPEYQSQERGDRALHAATLSPRHAVNVQMQPAITMATGTIRNARSSELASDKAPISGGDGMSPTRCITSTDNPSAVARSSGATALTIAELTGPVLMKISSSEMTMPLRYIVLL